MTWPPVPLAAVVLAAGAGSRFSSTPGAKLLAELDGSPLLDHVLRAVRTFGPAVTIVVMGHGADALEGSLAWATELRVRNRAPERGLASSLRVGFDTLRARPEQVQGAFVVLGDQPRLRTEVMSSLAAAVGEARRTSRPIVVPRYAEDTTAGSRNPVLLLRPAWPFVDSLSGDRGLGPLLAQRPDLILEVPVTGTNPDVDRPDDLAALAEGGPPS